MCAFAAILSNNRKRIVKLKDIADVQIEEAKEYVRINANGKDGILLAVVKQPNANLIEISNELEKKVEELKKSLPNDVKILPYYVQADFVNDSIHGVTISLILGLFLAIIAAIIFLQSWKASVTILLTIPVTLLLTIIILYLTGQALNIMTGR